MYPHPEHGWPKEETPQGREKVQEVRKWIWTIARAHKVNAENILKIKDWQFPKAAVKRLEHNNYIDDDGEPALYFRRALTAAWEL